MKAGPMKEVFIN